MSTSTVSESSIQRVLDFVASSGEPVTANTIAVTLGMHKQSVGSALRALLKRELLSRQKGDAPSGGRPPFLYTAASDSAPAAPASATIRFRGSNTAVRKVYTLLTGSTYGKGGHPSAASILRHRSVANYSDEAVYQALNTLEAAGVIRHSSQVGGKPGRANRRYEVMVDRDPNFDTGRSKRRPRVATPTVEAVPVVSDDTSLEARVAALEDQVTDLLAALRAV